MKPAILTTALCVAFCSVLAPKAAHSAQMLRCTDFTKDGVIVPGVSRPSLDRGSDGKYELSYTIQGMQTPWIATLTPVGKLGNVVNLAGGEGNRTTRVSLRLDSNGQPDTAAVYVGDSIAQCVR